MSSSARPPVDFLLCGSQLLLLACPGCVPVPRWCAQQGPQAYCACRHLCRVHAWGPTWSCALWDLHPASNVSGAAASLRWLGACRLGVSAQHVKSQQASCCCPNNHLRQRLYASSRLKTCMHVSAATWLHAFLCDLFCACVCIVLNASHPPWFTASAWLCWALPLLDSWHVVTQSKLHDPRVAVGVKGKTMARFLDTGVQPCHISATPVECQPQLWACMPYVCMCVCMLLYVMRVPSQRWTKASVARAGCRLAGPVSPGAPAAGLVT
jgi:hypothetical protein